MFRYVGIPVWTLMVLCPPWYGATWCVMVLSPQPGGVLLYRVICRDPSGFRLFHASLLVVVGDFSFLVLCPPRFLFGAFLMVVVAGRRRSSAAGLLLPQAGFRAVAPTHGPGSLLCSGPGRR